LPHTQGKAAEKDVLQTKDLANFPGGLVELKAICSLRLVGSQLRVQSINSSGGN